MPRRVWLISSVFLMLAGNLQSVSYAEEIAGETVERIALATEEKSSESLREREEEKEAVLSSEEKREERKTSLESSEQRRRLCRGRISGVSLSFEKTEEIDLSAVYQPDFYGKA